MLGSTNKTCQFFVFFIYLFRSYSVGMSDKPPSRAMLSFLGGQIVEPEYFQGLRVPYVVARR
jgi:hypothetical protein